MYDAVKVVTHALASVPPDLEASVWGGGGTVCDFDAAVNVSQWRLGERIAHNMRKVKKKHCTTSKCKYYSS